MSEARTAGIEVIDRNGIRGTLDLSATQPDDNASPRVCVRLGGDARIFVATEKIIEGEDGRYRYPESFDEALLAQEKSSSDMSTQTPSGINAATIEKLVVPIVAEELRVEKRTVERGGVRIVKTVSERVETIDLPLMEEQTDVVRVPINRAVEIAPPVRYEGDVMIVPLLEEVVVVEKRLMLREELHIRKRQVEIRKPQQVILRREEANVERFRHDEGSEKTP